MNPIKTLLICLALVVASFPEQLRAQPVPNGDFETWKTTGTFWNQTLSLENWTGLKVSTGFMDYNINTPARVTDAQNGNYAVSIKSAKLSPLLTTIISGLISTMDTAGVMDSLIDLNRPFPGFLTNANFDLLGSASQIAQFASLFSGGLTDMDSASLAALTQMDVSGLLQGGMRVDSVPKSMSGYYKYVPGTAAVMDSVDAGLALLVGVGPDTSGRRRLITGVGAYALAAKSSYTAFTVPYIQLSEQYPDTVVILFLSSFTYAAENSTLTLDHLTMKYHAIDSVRNLQLLSVGVNEASFQWDKTPQASTYQVACLPAGDTTGMLLPRISLSRSYTLQRLEEATTYDFYVRAGFGWNVYGPWSRYTFTTLESPCERVDALSQNGDTLRWKVSDTAYRYQLQYALVSDAALRMDTTFGTGSAFWGDSLYWKESGRWADSALWADAATWVQALSWEDTLLNGTHGDANLRMTYLISGLLPDTVYAVRVRAWCKEERHGAWSGLFFRTAVNDDAVTNCERLSLKVFPNPSDGQCFLQVPEGTYLLQLFNPVGQCVWQKEVTGGLLPLRLEQPGCYLLRLWQPGGASLVTQVRVVR